MADTLFFRLAWPGLSTSLCGSTVVSQCALKLVGLLCFIFLAAATFILVYVRNTTVGYLDNARRLA